MQLPDVNVLIYAHRQDAPEHDRYAAWLRALVEAPEPFAVAEIVLAGFLRIVRSEEHTSELQSQSNLVCRLLLEEKKNIFNERTTPPTRTPRSCGSSSPCTAPESISHAETSRRSSPSNRSSTFRFSAVFVSSR